MDFPPLSREYGQDGVGLLIVPAFDFVADGWLHSRMAIMRGVESGFSMARAANSGRLTLSDNRGRVLAEAHSDAGPFATLLGSVPVHHDSTLYARWGDWFSWLSAAALVVVAASLTRRRPAQ
jgi:apolipoprotein N-acyltransferase